MSAQQFALEREVNNIHQSLVKPVKSTAVAFPPCKGREYTLYKYGDRSHRDNFGEGLETLSANRVTDMGFFQISDL